MAVHAINVPPSHVYYTIVDAYPVRLSIHTVWNAIRMNVYHVLLDTT
jgi:hypothetical protein